ncbi:MAG: hypothetical protein MRY32_00905 [Rickettsiales bacterium]|nr:hypothetical protein [Rickettsiales bacterium]
MWWLCNLLLFIGLLQVSACGFTPIHAKESPMQLEIADMLEAIQITAPRGKHGEMFKAALEDQLNPMANPIRPAYRLVTSISNTAEPLIIQSDGTAARYRIQINSRYELVRISDGQVVSNGNLRRSVSYNVSEDDDYATYIEKKDAFIRGLTELAEDYKLRIGAEMAKRLKPRAGV